MIFSQFCFRVCIRKGLTAIGSGLPGSCNWHGATAAELAIGTAIRASPERLRTVANGCERLRNVERTQPQPPDPQSDTGTLATHPGKKHDYPMNMPFTTIKQIATFVDSPIKPSWAARAKWSSARPRDERHPPNEGLALAAASLRDSLRGTKY